jgi:GGDEF domain-containing protein
VAQSLSLRLRGDDILCTSCTGGFLVLCSTANLGDASAVADRLRLAVQAEGIPMGADFGPATISAGIAERSEATPSAAVLLQYAEAALEFGAMEGPNQIHPAA